MNIFKPGRLFSRYFKGFLTLLFFLPCLLITVQADAQSKFYSICFGSYKNKNYAAEAVSRLKEKDYDAFFEYEEVQGKGKYYRAYVGKFNSVAEAKRKADQLITLEIIPDYFINTLFDEDQAELPDIDHDTESYSLHVSSFKKKSLAEKEVRRFSKPGHRAEISEEMVNGEIWFRVYLGPFRNKAEAQAAAAELKKDKIISYYRLSKRDQGSNEKEQAKPSYSLIPLEPAAEKLEKSNKAKAGVKADRSVSKESILEEYYNPETESHGNAIPDILKTENAIQIKDILFLKTQMNVEMLHIYSSRFFVADISFVQGENPQVVVDIKDAVPVKKGFSKIDVNGKIIRRIRSYFTGESGKFRIVLDLVPENDYSAEQFFYKKENILSLFVKRENTE